MTVDLSPEDQALLDRAEAHTHICGLCFPLYITYIIKGEEEGVRETWTWEITTIIRQNLEAVLNKPKSRRKFVYVQSQGMWFHATCWKWLQAIDRKSERG